jgi:hypothetical protein
MGTRILLPLMAALLVGAVCALAGWYGAAHRPAPVPVRQVVPASSEAPLPPLPAELPWCGPQVAGACRVVTA